jgi:hypothetical protein
MGCGASTAAQQAKATQPKLPKLFHNLVVPDIRGNIVDFKTLKGKVRELASPHTDLARKTCAKFPNLLQKALFATECEQG